MKYAVLAIGLATTGVVAVSSPASASTTCAGQPADLCLAQDINYGGSVYPMWSNDANYANHGWLNDSVSSLRWGRECWITFYKDAYDSGPSFTVQPWSLVPDVRQYRFWDGSGTNDQISSHYSSCFG
jgi:hypothetical protein